jgi:hypothetical protein
MCSCLPTRLQEPLYRHQHGEKKRKDGLPVSSCLISTVMKFQQVLTSHR